MGNNYPRNKNVGNFFDFLPMIFIVGKSLHVLFFKNHHKT